MTATTTQSFNRKLIQDLLDDVTDNSNYYIAIGRSNPWPLDNDDEIDAPHARMTNEEERNLRLGLQSAKKILSISYVVPRVNWVSGTTYTQWDDSLEASDDITTSESLTNGNYVLVDGSSVFLCIENEGKPSVHKPVKQDNPVKGTDGYKWKFLYTITGDQLNKFRTDLFMPIQRVPDNTTVGFEMEQGAVQDAAIEGQIANVAIVDTNHNLMQSDNLTIVGDGTGAVVTGRYNDVSALIGVSVTNQGSDYNYAEIRVNGNRSDTFKVNVSPREGFGYDPRVDLSARAIMFSITLSDEDVTSQTDSYRQICILRSPVKPDGNPYDEPTGDMLRSLNFTSDIGDKVVDGSKIIGGTSGAIAFADSVVGSDIYFHQDLTTGFTEFVSGEQVGVLDDQGNIQSGSETTLVSGTYQSDPDIDPFSGEIMFIENRAIVARDSAQTENIKIVIEV